MRRPNTPEEAVRLWADAEQPGLWHEGGGVAARLVRATGEDRRHLEVCGDSGSAPMRFRSLPDDDARPRTVAVSSRGVVASIWCEDGAETGRMAMLDVRGVSALTVVDAPPLCPAHLAWSRCGRFVMGVGEDALVTVIEGAEGWRAVTLDVDLAVDRGTVALASAVDGGVVVTWVEAGTVHCARATLVEGRCAVERIDRAPTVDAPRVAVTSRGLAGWEDGGCVLRMREWSGGAVRCALPAQVADGTARVVGVHADADRVIVRVAHGEGFETHDELTRVPGAPVQVWRGSVGERTVEAALMGGTWRHVDASPLAPSPGGDAVEGVRTWSLEVPVGGAGRRVTVECAGPVDDSDDVEFPVLLTCYGGFGQRHGLESGPAAVAWATLGGTMAAADVQGSGSVQANERVVSDLGEVARFFRSRGRTVVLVGASHGAWLAAMVALRFRSDVTGVVLGNPLLDLVEMTSRHGFGRLWLREFGLVAEPDAAESLSPLRRLERGAVPPPSLVLGSSRDARVSGEDARRWVEASTAAGVPAQYREFGAGHGAIGRAAADARLLSIVRWASSLPR